jgi:hypothetical protein
MRRRTCSSCNCETFHHAAMYNPYNNPVDRMCVEEDISTETDEARDKGYAWVPRGLSALEVGLIGQHDEFSSVILFAPNMTTSCSRFLRPACMH